ncbi:MAG TPA: hypothetical protein VFI41_04775 [Gemmatimonadales bacterium]|nr:hypothetical protein [Gemmatimonadales bacterium]
MNCYIEHVPIVNVVRAWLYDDTPEGTIYMWPTNDQGTWRQEIVPHHQQRPDSVRPLLELTGQMWTTFIEAMRAEDGEVPAGQLLFKTLEREQNRVDALIHALIKQTEPQMFITSEGT